MLINYDEQNDRTPPKFGSYGEIHPLCPRDFPRPPTSLVLMEHGLDTINSCSRQCTDSISYIFIHSMLIVTIAGEENIQQYCSAFVLHLFALLESFQEVPCKYLREVMKRGKLQFGSCQIYPKTGKKQGFDHSHTISNVLLQIGMYTIILLQCEKCILEFPICPASCHLPRRG